MKTLFISLGLFAASLSGWSQTVSPATTNRNQTFYGVNSFVQPITLLSHSASTVVKVDGAKSTASIANGTGALTNDGSGGFGWFNSFASTVQLLSLSNSMVTLINSSSNSLVTQITTTSNGLYQLITNSAATNLDGWTAYVDANTNVVVTNTISAAYTIVSLNNIITSSGAYNQLAYTTNQFTMAPDFSRAAGHIATNASFTFLLPLNVNSGKDQTTVFTVDNTLGSPIQATAPANVVVVPGSVMWVTNRTKFTFNQDGVETNLYAVPTR